MNEKIFTAQVLTKTYTSGEVEVRALRGLDLEIWAAESRCAGSVRPAGPSKWKQPTSP
jgi:hypothetical protein